MWGTSRNRPNGMRGISSENDSAALECLSNTEAAARNRPHSAPRHYSFFPVKGRGRTADNLRDPFQAESHPQQGAAPDSSISDYGGNHENEDPVPFPGSRRLGVGPSQRAVRHRAETRGRHDRLRKS